MFELSISEGIEEFAEKRPDQIFAVLHELFLFQPELASPGESTA